MTTAKTLAAALVASLLGVSVAQAGGDTGGDGLKISGFVGPYFKYKSHKSGDETVVDKEGFALGDAAVYLEYSAGPTSVFVDLPFANPGNFGFTSKGQAYVNYAPVEGFSVQAGQFDTIYGFELNDAKDRFFSVEGIVLEAFLPTFHNGLLVSYETHGAFAKVLAASPKNSAFNGTNDNYDYGVQVGWANDMFRATGNYLMDHVAGQDSGLTLTEAIVGGSFAGVDVDFNYAMEASGVDNTDSKTGMLLHATYAIADTGAAVGFRYESVDNADNNADLDDAASLITVGAAYNVSKAAKVKAEYGMGSNNAQASAGAEVTSTDSTYVAAAFEMHF